MALADALRATAAASALVRPLTAAPDLDGWAIVERLLKDLARLEDRVWLVIDDVHELASAEALRQLELLVMRAPDRLRFVLATRHDLRLGLHRLRLEGELTEIRAVDLRFTLAETRALFDAAGVQLPELEQAGAFVVSLDARRSWFRYHQMFADLLQLELRHSEPAQIPALHGMAAGWFAGHGYPVEAVRHAQAAQDWGLAARLLADHWLGLVLDGQGATAYEFLTRFPAGAVAADAELIALMAAGGPSRGSARGGRRYPRPAARGVRGGGGPVPGAPARR